MQVAPRCEHFGECGGCSLQNLAYAAQLRVKELQARLQTSPSKQVCWAARGLRVGQGAAQVHSDFEVVMHEG